MPDPRALVNKVKNARPHRKRLTAATLQLVEDEFLKLHVILAPLRPCIRRDFECEAHCAIREWGPPALAPHPQQLGPPDRSSVRGGREPVRTRLRANRCPPPDVRRYEAAGRAQGPARRRATILRRARKSTAPAPALRRRTTWAQTASRTPARDRGPTTTIRSVSRPGRRAGRQARPPPFHPELGQQEDRTGKPLSSPFIIACDRSPREFTRFPAYSLSLMRNVLHHYAGQMLFAGPMIPVALAVFWLAKHLEWSDQTVSKVLIALIIGWAVVVLLFADRIISNLGRILFRRSSTAEKTDNSNSPTTRFPAKNDPSPGSPAPVAPSAPCAPTR